LLSIPLLGISLFGPYEGDFWEHSAVVRELAENPWSPQHPLFLVDLPHAFFSPYLLVLGLISRFTSADAVNVLTVAGLLNFIFFVASFRLFVGCFFKKNVDLIVFYALLFVLFFWPSDSVWMWSGFYHFKVLPGVLPYPSTFSMATTFLLLTLFHKALQINDWHNFLIPILLTAVVILTHPTTALFALTGLCSISAQSQFGGNKRGLLLGAIVILGALALTMLWPYYSFIELIRANNPSFHLQSITLYQQLPDRLYALPVAVLIASPVIVNRLRTNYADALLLLLLGTVALYVLGGLVESYGVGRVISCVAIVLQILLGAAASKMELLWRSGRRLLGIPLLILFGFTLAINAGNTSTFEIGIAGLTGQKRSLANWRALSHQIGQYDVVIADLDSGWKLPTFAGKVVASPNPVHWVSDSNQRVKDVESFFAEGAGTEARSEIISKYCASYILLTTNQANTNLWFEELGTQIYENPELVLLKVNPTLTRPGCEMSSTEPKNGDPDV